MTNLEETRLLLEVQKVILENRSLAENGPENLLKFPPALKYYKEFGPKLFSLAVESILDENE